MPHQTQLRTVDNVSFVRRRRIFDATIAPSSASRIKISLSVPVSLTILRARQYSTWCDLATYLRHSGSSSWLFALLPGKLRLEENQESKESLASAQPGRDQSESMRLALCRWRMQRLSSKTIAAKSRHLPLTIRDIFEPRYRRVTIKSRSREGNPALADSALSKSTLRQGT